MRHSISWLCRKLKVARSGYYARREQQEAPGKRTSDNAVISAEIEAVFRDHKSFYSCLRIHQELRVAGRCVGRHRVAWFMSSSQLRAKTHRAFRTCSRAFRLYPALSILIYQPSSRIKY
jgi:hypothetical protein